MELRAAPELRIAMYKPVFFHVDVNSAFLSFEAAYETRILGHDLDIRNIPSVIGGNQATRHGIVLAKSQPAKKYGIKTGEPLVDARSKCPGLLVIPPDYSVYVECSRRFMELLRRFSPHAEQYSIDEAFCDFTGTEGLYGAPVVFANELREMIREELGFTVNIGVSSNKLLAKMASDFKKPDRVHTLFPDEIPDKMWPLPVGDLFYVGHATERKLNTLGITTIGELANTPVEILRPVFRSFADVIVSYANGLDLVISTSNTAANKGYGNSATIHYDVTDRGDAKQVLLSLSETVGMRIRADDAFISVVAVSITDMDFNHISAQMTLPSPTDITEKIYAAACRVFDTLWKLQPIRQLGVHTSKVCRNNGYQYSLFDGVDHEKLIGLDHAIDEIRKVYGEDSVMRACFLKSCHNHMSGGISKDRRNGITKAV